MAMFGIVDVKQRCSTATFQTYIASWNYRWDMSSFSNDDFGRFRSLIIVGNPTKTVIVSFPTIIIVGKHTFYYFKPAIYRWH